MSTKFTEEHEWASLSDGLVTVGITDFAQQQLGEVVFVELPDVDRKVSQGEEAAIVESVKAAGEVKAPVSGTVVAVNEALDGSPELVNDSPATEGWFYKIKPDSESDLDNLMGADAYQNFIADLA